MYKNGFGINNLQWLMCHRTKPNQTKPNLLFYFFFFRMEKILKIQLILKDSHICKRIMAKKKKPVYIGGIDISFNKEDQNKGWITLAVIRMSDLKVSQDLNLFFFFCVRKQNLTYIFKNICKMLLFSKMFLYIQIYHKEVTKMEKSLLDGFIIHWHGLIYVSSVQITEAKKVNSFLGLLCDPPQGTQWTYQFS